MRTIIRNISLLLCVVASVASCQRKPIYDDCLCNNMLPIPIDIEWTRSGVTPQNVTVLVYNSDNGELAYEHTYEHNTKEIQSYVNLPIGRYQAVVFNELRDQIDYLRCVGYEKLSTLKFESTDDSPLRSRSETRGYIKQSGDLAVVKNEKFEVTDEMIVEAAIARSEGEITTRLSAETKATIGALTDIVPMKKNSTINIRAHFKNIYYARMPALVDLVNLADGYFVDSDQNSSTTSTLQFTMSDRAYDDGSYYDGTISATLTSFGTLVDRSSTAYHDSTLAIVLDVLFKMIDEEQTEVNRNMEVTTKLTQQDQNDGSVLMDIDVYFEKALPVVKPDSSTDESGFGSSVEGWGDVVDVPLS